NILKHSYLSHWRTDGSSPALLFNTTEVATGARRVISPFIFPGTELSFLPVWTEPWTTTISSKRFPIEIPLSTAAIASARYPWLTPAGWFYDVQFKSGTRQPLIRDGDVELRQVQVVDGGYFDNSGVLTALELIRAMRSAAAKAGLANTIQINLIVLAAKVGPDRRVTRATELTAPIEGLLRARVATGRATVDTALHRIGERTEVDRGPAGGPDTIRRVELMDVGYPLPLGWRLSEMTRLLMRTQSGDRRLCGKILREQLIETSSEPACTAE